MIDRIELLSEIKDIDKLTFADIRWKFGTGISLDKYMGRGKQRQLVKKDYRHGVMTDIGDIREHIWYELAEALIKREQEEWLLEALIEHYKGSNLVGKNPKHYCLEIHSNRIFDSKDWVDYIPFNLKYRPELIINETFIEIVPACCKKPALITKELYKRRREDRAYCPHCGRWSEFEYIGESKYKEY